MPRGTNVLKLWPKELSKLRKLKRGLISRLSARLMQKTLMLSRETPRSKSRLRSRPNTGRRQPSLRERSRKSYVR